jgi:hypothetical protein
MPMAAALMAVTAFNIVYPQPIFDDALPFV